MKNISDILGIKIYYPFLRDQSGIRYSIHNQVDKILTYLFLVDIVVLPPRDIFNDELGLKNEKSIMQNPVLLEALTRQRIQLTSSHDKTDDVARMIEAYRYKNIYSSDLKKIPVVLRDGDAQNSSYKQYISGQFAFSSFIPNDEKLYLFETIRRMKSHDDFSFSLINSEVNWRTKRFLKDAALDAYRLGGSAGNFSIMPSKYLQAPTKIYNPFYSRYISQLLLNRFTQLTGSSFGDIKPEHYFRMIDALSPFRKLYNQYSLIHNKFNQRTLNLFRRFGKPWFFWSRFLSACIGFAASSLLSLIINPEIISNPLHFYSINATTAIIYTLNQISEKITGNIFNRAMQIMPFLKNSNELHQLIDEFDASVKKLELVAWKL